MKKLLLVLTLFLMLFLVSCNNYDGLDYYFGGYQVYYESHGTCEMYIKEVIYEDDNATYFLGAGGCGGDSFYYIKYNNDYVDIPSALEQRIITINDVVTSGLPALIIEDK